MPDYDNYYCYDLETKQTQTVNTGVSYIDFDYAEGKTYMKNRGKWLKIRNIFILERRAQKSFCGAKIREGIGEQEVL